MSNQDEIQAHRDAGNAARKRHAAAAGDALLATFSGDAAALEAARQKSIAAEGDYNRHAAEIERLGG
ncbi:hypothetical protein GCM10023195_60370 [Actinoallomurus liliacearum]|uniref:Uncharacterized protein n=1 Tax=Actinoallomurus liliacearum TaxID=1080073 RepID=A0ABP8TUE6_9ACTN